MTVSSGKLAEITEGYSVELADLLAHPAITTHDLADIALWFTRKSDFQKDSPVPGERAWSAAFAFIAASAEVALLRKQTGQLV
jgi:hypothetical protein